MSQSQTENNYLHQLRGYMIAGAYFSVCLSAGLLKKLRADLAEMLREG